MLKQVYLSSYWKIRKIFLDLVEDLLSQDSFIGSTISTKSREISCASKISSPSMMFHDTKSSKVSKESNISNFYPKNLNHAFMSKPNFEEYRREENQKFEESRKYVVEDDVEEADNPSSFMKMIKARTDTV